MPSTGANAGPSIERRRFSYSPRSRRCSYSQRSSGDECRTYLPLLHEPLRGIGQDARVNLLPTSVAVAKTRTWQSVALFAAGYALLAIDNFFLPGGFNWPLAWLCMAAMVLGLLGLIASVWSWWRLRRRAGTGA
jgi:hypothetical protein